MRSGINPLKFGTVAPPYKRHRVIMAVYIPEQDGYWTDALEIFRLSLASLLATVDRDHVSITIVDNASIPEVGAILSEAAAQGLIDKHVRHAVNRGKPDAIIAELKASYERFVTLVDSDVLFLPAWLESVEAVYRTWPAAAAVCPGGQPKLTFFQTTSTWLYGAARFAVKLGKFVPDEDMRQFARSIGKDAFYPADELAAQYALRRGTEAALIGAGHFVITVRRACYDAFDYAPLLEGTGYQSLRMFDEHVDRVGGLRLSTTRAHVLHMGNTPETWMHERLAAIRSGAPVKLAPADHAVLDADWTRTAVLPYVLRRAAAKPVMLAARLYRRYRRAPASRNTVGNPAA